MVDCIEVIQLKLLGNFEILFLNYIIIIIILKHM
jgi:hypothetical protein